ncbi:MULTISPECIES: cytochrome c [unclassified Ruegeria]|uniref:c-type cytochrome n=1 Tax=unclassified Ruegeria TaxID=2625375 RepID=UPI001488CDB0|nr:MULTISPECIES: cytochrome c [unclassified Ruegeria]
MRGTVLTLCFASVCAVSGSEALAQDAEVGAELYQHYCATCHGLDATGNGPMAGVLVVQPVNLRTLAGDDGVFPTARVVARIDGRDPLVSHGSPMPVYGPYFEGQDTAMKTPAGQPILTSQPIVDLVEYLMTIQDG